MTRKLKWPQVRDAIDSGETGDKVDYPDPAAAPLGTDEEAGGASTPPEDIAESTERLKPRQGDGKQDESEGTQEGGDRRRGFRGTGGGEGPGEGSR